METTKSNSIEPQDAHLLLIDRLLKTGWVSYTDMSLLLNEHFGRLVNPEGKTEQEFYHKLMHSEKGSTAGGYYMSLIKAAINKMVMVWTQAHKGEKCTPNKKMREEFIESKWIYPKDSDESLAQYSLSDATLLYLRNYSRGQRIAIFTYKVPGYSIRRDLEFYNEKLSHRSSVRNQKQIVSGISYDRKTAERYRITPAPEVIERKIVALKLKALKEALVRDTSEAVQRRLVEIEYLTQTKPEGWLNKTADLYLNAIYDGMGIIDNQELESVINQFQSHLLNHFRVDFFPHDSIVNIIDYKKYCSREQNKIIADSLSSLVCLLSQEEFSSKDIDTVQEYCWKAACDLIRLNEEQYQVMEKLYVAVDNLLSSTVYVYDLAGVSAALTLYGFDNSIDVNVITDALYGLISCIRNHYQEDESNCEKAEETYINKCRGIIKSLNQDDPIERFIIGLVELSICFIKRSVPNSVGEIIRKDDIKIAFKQLNDEQQQHFTEIYQIISFEVNRKRFFRAAINSKDTLRTLRAFETMIIHLLDNMLKNIIFIEEGSINHERFVFELEQQANLLTKKPAATDTIKQLHILLKYAIILLKNKPYPQSIVDGGKPETCKTELMRTLKEAEAANMNEKNKQTLLFLLTLTVLGNINVPWQEFDDEKEEFVNDYKMRDEALEYLPIADWLVNQMSTSKMKTQLLSTIIKVKEDKSYGGLLW